MSESQGRNRLGEEKSPYLLQHKDNPVWWYAWGEEAFAAAKAGNKPIFLSVGYSTCYWCHVMEKDSFERAEVAALLNKYFISVKVDREERPDVDQIYMDAVVQLTGQGGWPMSVFITPELKPFWGGTFFYRTQFMSILEQLGTAWQTNRAVVDVSSSELTQALQDPAHLTSVGNTKDLLNTALRAYEQTFDIKYGGFGEAPKFPPAVQISLLVRLQKSLGGSQAMSIVQKTLDGMAWGGIHDQLGGGFHRYATDQRWIIPHFEKMLYDNALLAVSYLEAYQLTREQRYADVGRSTIDYVLTELNSGDGGFYSGQDAGEVGKEGEFYVWKAAELEGLLTAEELACMRDSFAVTGNGNFEGETNILYLRQHLPWGTRQRPEFLSAREKLLAKRSTRHKPHRDEKILTAWNGLMISALAAGYRVLGEKKYLDAAVKAAVFFREKMQAGTLLRSYFNGSAGVPAFCEDYAYLIEALINLYESDFNPEWIFWAEKLQAEQDTRFWDSKNGGYFFSDAKELIARKKEWIDNATPASNAVTLNNLQRLSKFLIRPVYQERIKSLAGIYFGLISRSRAPTAFPKALTGLYLQGLPSKELVIAPGGDAQTADAMIRYIRESFHPLLSLARVPADKSQTLPDLLKDRGAVGGKTAFYVCDNHVCKLPVTDIEEAKRLLS